MSRAFLLIPLLCIGAAACSSSSKTVTITSLATTTTTSASAGSTTTVAGSARESVFILSVDTNAHTLTVDPMQFLTGVAAVTAFKQAHPNASGPDNDYYIENPTKDHAVLSLDPKAEVRLVQVGGKVHNPPVPAPLSTLASYPALPDHPFWITIQRGVVTAVDEQFVP